MLLLCQDVGCLHDTPELRFYSTLQNVLIAICNSCWINFCQVSLQMQHVAAKGVAQNVDLVAQRLLSFKPSSSVTWLAAVEQVKCASRIVFELVYDTRMFHCIITQQSPLLSFLSLFFSASARPQSLWKSDHRSRRHRKVAITFFFHVVEVREFVDNCDLCDHWILTHELPRYIPLHVWILRISLGVFNWSTHQIIGLRLCINAAMQRVDCDNSSAGPVHVLELLSSSVDCIVTSAAVLHHTTFVRRTSRK